MKGEAKELMKLLSMIDPAGAEDAEDSLPSIEGQRELLSEYLSTTVPQSMSLQPGNFVERNHLGKKRYRFPNSKQLAMVVSVFDRPMLDEDGSVVHGEIATVVPSGIIRSYAVDFRYYQKAA